MKKIIAALLILVMCSALFAAFDSDYSDKLFYNQNEYEKDFAYLQDALTKATSNDEKAEILWRLARTRLTLTDDNKESLTEAERLAAYGDYGANDKPKADDTTSAYYYAYTSLTYKETPNGLHWESSAVGRAGQEHGALNSLSKASPMRKLEVKALEEFDSFPLQTDAWYLLGILYDALPGKPISFGNNNSAISYMRKCVMTQDLTNRTNGTNYLELAEQLYKRDWDAKKRAKEFASMLKDYNKGSKNGLVEMNKDFEGYMATLGAPYYMAAELSSVSDKQEAIALLTYGISVIDAKLPSASTEAAKAKMLAEREKMDAKLKTWK